MSQQSRILQLATRIAANTAKVDAALTNSSIPTPSFSESYPLDSHIFPDSINAARHAVIRDTLELQQLLLGPREHILSYNPNHLLSQLAIVRYNLANAVPINGSATFADLAAASATSTNTGNTQLSERHIRKLIRHAITQHIFAEPSPGVITHTAASRLLAEDADFAAWVRWAADDCWPAAYHALDAMARWPDSEEPYHTGYALAHYPPPSSTSTHCTVPNSEDADLDSATGNKNGNNITLFEFLASHPDRAARFAAGMRLYAKRPGLAVHHTVEGWKEGWEALLPISGGVEGQGATIVDVGGSHGEVAILLARTFPSSQLKQVIVQDIDAATVQSAGERLDAELKGMGNDEPRVRYMVHDFFEPQPVKGADVYFFRACFHNWSDGYAVRMLRALVPALKVGACVVVNDVVVPGWEELELGKDGDGNGNGEMIDVGAVRNGDLSMSYLFNAGDRELSD